VLRYLDVVRSERKPPSIPSTATAQSLIGRELDGRYRVDAPLGVGGMGAVYRATHLRLGRQVAIKILLEQYGTQASFLVRFEREAKALASLGHPNIVSITDYGVADELPYLVMELLEGETLSARLRRAPFPPGQVLEFATQILRALSFVHERGLVHRDLKPGNVFLQRLPGGGETLKLLDFGLAKHTHADPSWVEQSLTNAGEIVGTPSYISPEQVACESADARTDVYSMGVMLFEMLSGRLPFEGRPADQLKMHLVAPIPTLSKVCPKTRVSPELEAFIQRAMAKQREDRFQDAAEMLSALEALEQPWLWADNNEPTSGIALSNAMLSPVPIEIDSKGGSRRSPSRGSQHAGRGWFVGGALCLASAAFALALFTKDAPQRSSPRSAEATPSAGLAAEAEGDGQGVRAAPALETTPAPVEQAVPQPELVVTEAEAEAEAVAVPSEADEKSGTVAAPSEAEPNAEPQDSDEVALEEMFEADLGVSGDNVIAGAQTADEAAVIHDATPTPRPAPARAEPRRSPAKNPWNKAIPRELRAIRSAVGSGAVGSERTIVALRNYNRTNGDDPRGHLLLARLYLNRNWRADALNQYTIAYRLDASARGASHMLNDLIELAAHGPVAGETGRLIREAYGPEAVGAIDRALVARKKDPESVARLRALRARLIAR
jgi:eukaryotic-like serine/threonine-protein kinase